MDVDTVGGIPEWRSGAGNSEGEHMINGFALVQAIVGYILLKRSAAAIFHRTSPTCTLVSGTNWSK